MVFKYFYSSEVEMSLVRTRAVAVHSLSATEFVDQRTAVTEDRTVVLF